MTFDSGSGLGLDTSDGTFTLNNASESLPLTVLGPNTLTLTGDTSLSGVTVQAGSTVELASTPAQTRWGKPRSKTPAPWRFWSAARRTGRGTRSQSLYSNVTFDSGSALGLDTTDGTFTIDGRAKPSA